ncbi:MAG: gamma-glutamyl-gamma-aminobutyrate hydrolase family protein [Phycisphaerales bacterium]|nr:gamma-glutamyl-gamma-aminobutyrate hydrolase family protein [Phycisphaerales bacterium]
MCNPIIGVTANLVRDDKGRPRHEVKHTYISAVLRAGGTPIILPAIASVRAAMIQLVDGIIMTGGDDIDTRPFGIALHPEAQIMDSDRQAAEFALLDALAHHPDKPVLGICLGMQLMGVHAGCTLIQHLHDHKPDGDRHRFDNVHPVESAIGSGAVASWHHQALADAGPFEAIGWSDDGILEAIRDSRKPFYVGVQWHPERTRDATMGDAVIAQLIAAARNHKQSTVRA